MTTSRIQNIVSHLVSNTNERKLPSFDELPKFKTFSGCAWELWGKDDQLGTINLLTDEVVKQAAKEIKIGKSVCLNWPVNFPGKPAFSRQPLRVEIINTVNHNTMFDDTIYMNTQSGTQWDGLRHFPLREYGILYQNTPNDSLKKGHFAMPDPNNIDPETIKLGIHNWAQHGICGRGVLLDIVKYYTASGKQLPYDPWTTHPINVAELQACAKEQGVTFKTGDILLLRIGFIQKYCMISQEKRDSLSSQPETFAGIEQSEDMKRFLWDNHFAAVASDQPSLERWPTPEGVPHLHQTLLVLWGMPIGEFFDLETLSEVCAQTGRYTFFFTSWPLNSLGGVASPPNAAAYF